METFFGTLKIELVDRRRWRTRQEIDTASTYDTSGRPHAPRRPDDLRH